jgi:predicted hydrocarbon binding protein
MPRKKVEEVTDVDVLEQEAEPTEGEVLDEKLVEDTVSWIRDTLARTLYRAASEVGEYVLEKFFKGDPELVRSKNPHKNASFRELCKKCGTGELPIAKTWLNNAVNVAVANRLLPENSPFKQLSTSHQIALLPLHEPAKIDKLSQKASSKNLSVRDLRELVTAELEKIEKEPSNLGRKPLPFIVKTLSRSLKIFAQESGRKSFTKAQIAELSEAQSKTALETARRLADTLNKFIKDLEEKA